MSDAPRRDENVCGVPASAGIAATPGQKALQHVARILEQRPKKDDHELSHLTRCLAAFRTELIARQHADSDSGRADDRTRLGRLNAIICVVMGMHFPIGEPPWDEFAKTHAWLTALVAEIA